ncbi:phosphoribosylaminoimidazolesuccinocarboxamide synthase [Haloquadratum walsbyi]|jgi:Phosphoribosylaminoimidazolesuccinocarboxamide (SAICAR) synthase|uniref:phosphoribosylaminoimidazolesuccinocarboxamide synthase n=1 Tax=Haloquadratum walsbyi J07HQW2 TaxID=1238425 RepID=U1NEI9_9EURY|nr:phosphoribosylaminoimidazolesuccinocarboxamide synthase [Haloquadratum walsbyi]ERG95420.1 MAG: phosphoribosylaminoimidazolesuccinocarboxamide (SAICAR) synthase [Haloquadratum walsbyi J07HQW2]
MASVKEFRVETEPTATEYGHGRFMFTDHYSVFDWGEMPDQIPHKGTSLCTMGAYNFELLEQNDISTHYLGVGRSSEAETTVDNQSSNDSDHITAVYALDECTTAPTEMVINLTQVPTLPYTDGVYDYESYHDNGGRNYLIPLEIVFRNTVPTGSSLRRRKSPREYGIDADAWPSDHVELSEPIIEFSTKYEEQDRYLDRAEAEQIAGVASLDKLEELALGVNRVITHQAEKHGFIHEDGKIECLYHDGKIIVADVAGTFDENRFEYNNQEVSKEVIRQRYKEVDAEWVSAVKDAKQQAEINNVAEWRDRCDRSPTSLAQPAIDAVADLYTAGANRYIDTQWFDAPSMDVAVENIQEL